MTKLTFFGHLAKFSDPNIWSIAQNMMTVMSVIIVATSPFFGARLATAAASQNDK